MSDDTEIIRQAMSLIGRRTSPRKAATSADNGRNSADKLRGRTVSAETRQRMREAQARRWAAKKSLDVSADTLLT